MKVTSSAANGQPYSDSEFTFPIGFSHDFIDHEVSHFLLEPMSSTSGGAHVSLRARAAAALDSFNDLLLSASQKNHPVPYHDIVQMLSTFTHDNRLDSLRAVDVIQQLRQLELQRITAQNASDWLSAADGITIALHHVETAQRQKHQRLEQLNQWADVLLSSMNTDTVMLPAEEAYLRNSIHDANASLLSLNTWDLQAYTDDLQARYEWVMTHFMSRINPLINEPLNETDYAPSLFLGEEVEQAYDWTALIENTPYQNTDDAPSLAIVDPWLCEVNWHDVYVAYQLYRDKKMFGSKPLQLYFEDTKCFGMIASINVDEMGDYRPETESLRTHKQMRLGTSEYQIRFFRHLNCIYQACFDLKDLRIAPNEDRGFTAMRKMLAMVEMLTWVMSQPSQGRVSLWGEPVMVASGIYYAKWLQSQGVILDQIVVEGIPADQILKLHGGSDIYQEAKHFVRFFTSTLGNAVKASSLYQSMQKDPLGLEAMA